MDEQPKIQKMAEDFIAGIEWLLRLLKEKKLVPLLSLLTIGLFAESYLGKAKPVITKIAELTGRSDWLHGLKAPHYSAVLITLAVALVVIIVINLLKKIRTEDALQPVSIKLDGPIKGLRSFEREDHPLFLRLQRHANISECCSAILPEDFRFGILIGESGCGK
jgi:hypothetical protein